MTNKLNPKVELIWLKTNILILYNNLGAAKGECKKCKAIIYFVTHKNGKQAPYTLEGSNHFADCPAAKDFKK